MQLRLELLDRTVDDVDIWSGGGERSVLLEFVEGLLAIVLGLVNDRDVEDRRRVFGVFTESGGEQGNGFLRSAAMEGDVAEAVEGLRVARAKVEGVFVAALGLVEPASARLSVAEFDPAIGGLRLEGAVAGEVLDGRAEVVLFERERAEIVAGGSEIDVEPERFPIIALRLFGLPRAVMSEAQMVPCLRIAGQVFGRLLQFSIASLNLPSLINSSPSSRAVGPGRRNRRGKAPGKRKRQAARQCGLFSGPNS